MSEKRKIFAKKMRGRTAASGENKLEIFAVPAAKVRSLNETLADPQVLERGITKPMEVNNAKAPLHMPTLGFKIDGETISPKTQPPRLGEHNSLLTPDPD